tara:strand:+ start:869 stop:1105 length:237 start_codon:yes stop_codon:yes gene_type:complete
MLIVIPLIVLNYAIHYDAESIALVFLAQVIVAQTTAVSIARQIIVLSIVKRRTAVKIVKVKNVLLTAKETIAETTVWG